MASVSFTLRMDETLKQQLDALAEREKRSTAFVMQQAATEYIERQHAFLAHVQALEAKADAGAFVSEEAMTEWFASLGAGNENNTPVSDIRFEKPVR